VDAIAEQLVNRLQSDPNDAEAYEALKSHYREANDAPSLTNLIAGWAAYQRDRHQASRGYFEASQVVATFAPQHQRRVTLLRKAVDRDIEFREAVLELVSLLEKLGDEHALAEFLDHHLRSLEKHNLAYDLAAQLYVRLGELWVTSFDRPDVARQCYDRALELDGGNPEIIAGARRLADKTENPALLARAIGAEAALEQDPERKVALYRQQADVYSREPADLNGCVQALRAAHQIAPHDVSTMRELADALTRRAVTRPAEAASRDLRRSAELHYLIAQLVSPSEAFAALQAALQLVPHHDGALHLLEQHAQQLGQEDQLPPYWAAYIAHAAEGPEVEQRRVYLARAYEQAGRFEEAIACLEVVQTQGIAANLLTDLKGRRGTRSLQPARTTISFDTDPPEPEAAEPLPPPLRSRRKTGDRPLDAERQMRELRRALRNAIAAGLHDEVVERCKEIREIDASDGEAFLLLETHYRKQADYPRLCELLRSPHVSGTTEDEHLQRLREVATLTEEKRGDTAEAIAAWHNVLELEPADAAAIAQLKRLLERTARWDDLVTVIERELQTSPDLDLTDRAELLTRLLAIHRDRRQDQPAAIEALTRLHELQPTAATRDELCELLLTSGAYGSAVPLLWQRAQEAEGEREHLRVLRQLAEIFETAVQEREAAFDVCTRILALRPKDIDALACMQRIDENSGNALRLLQTLERRAALLPRDERASLLLDMARIAERSLDSVERAGEYYGQALELDPGRPGALDALCELFASHGRNQELVALLDRNARAERDPARRVELRLRQARLLAGPLLDPSEAAAAYRVVLEHQENTEALAFLLDRAREEQDSEVTASLCARLAATIDDPIACRTLLYERAQVLVTELGRPLDAITTLRNLLANVDADYDPAIEWLAELAGNLGDNAGLATALARRLDKSTTQDARVALAKRLADLQEFDLNDREQATAALTAWAKADGNDPAPHRRLRPLLEESGRYVELVATCDALSDLETEQDARDEATLTAAQISFTHLRQFEAAWGRLLPLLDRGHSKAIALLLAIARQTNRCEELSALCVRAAQDATSSELQGELWGHAARIFREELGDPQKAFEAALRLLATDLKSRDALFRVEESAAQANLWTRLQPVYDRLIKAAESDGERIELLVRYADLLERGAGDASEALDRVLQASALAPADETLIARAERLAAQCGRGPELVRLSEQQAELTQLPSSQVEWLLRAARFALSTSDNRVAAAAFLEAALAATRADITLWEQCIAFSQQLDAQATTGEPHAALRALINAHKRVAEHSPAPVGATLILRASRLLDDRLNDERAAFDLLRAGCGLLPLDENLYDHLLQRAESTGRLDALDAHLSRGVDEALDARTAASLLARRARLLEGPLGRPDEAANVYVKLLQLRPDDMQATSKLRDSLRRARRFQDLLVVIHKQTLRAKTPDEKLELLKESAHVWELDLKNRWEAVDAWRKVLEISPRDGEAIRAITRLDRRSLPPMAPANTADVPDAPGESMVRPRDPHRGSGEGGNGNGNGDDGSGEGGAGPGEPERPADTAQPSDVVSGITAADAADPSLETAAKPAEHELDELPIVDLVSNEDSPSALVAEASGPARGRSLPPPVPSTMRRITGRPVSITPVPQPGAALPTPPLSDASQAPLSAPPRKH
jgi:tetratricopeptide (TPR) repeat protein